MKGNPIAKITYNFKLKFLYVYCLILILNDDKAKINR